MLMSNLVPTMATQCDRAAIGSLHKEDAGRAPEHRNPEPHRRHSGLEPRERASHRSDEANSDQSDLLHRRRPPEASSEPR